MSAQLEPAAPSARLMLKTGALGRFKLGGVGYREKL
jgi:hypothetical protein